MDSGHFMELIRKLSRHNRESDIDYDNRINELGYEHIGYAYFNSVNYNALKHIFAVYVLWNGGVNNCLTDPMPQGGFVMECDDEEARSLCRECRGYRVYGRLISVAGNVYVRGLYIATDNGNYTIYYNGANVTPPESIIYYDLPERIIENTGEGLKNFNICPESSSDNAPAFYKGSYSRGSFNIGSFNGGSFRAGSFGTELFNTGSFNMGSYNAGSYRTGGYNMSSFSVGSFRLGSFNVKGFGIGSYNVGSYSIGSYSMSSYNISSFSIGSYTAKSFNISSFGANISIGGSYSGGSFNMGVINMSSFNSGSYNISLYNTGSFNRSSFTSYSLNKSYANREFIDAEYDSNDKFKQGSNDDWAFEYLLDVVYGIGRMGYGLNMIDRVSE